MEYFYIITICSYLIFKTFNTNSKDAAVSGVEVYWKYFNKAIANLLFNEELLFYKLKKADRNKHHRLF